MPNYYNKEMMKQYMQSEQEKSSNQDKESLKKLKAAADAANAKAKIAFEQTQQNRFEIEELKRSLKRTRIITLVFIVLALICIAMVMAEGVNNVTSMLP